MNDCVAIIEAKVDRVSAKCEVTVLPYEKLVQYASPDGKTSNDG